MMSSSSSESKRCGRRARVLATSIAISMMLGAVPTVAQAREPGVYAFAGPKVTPEIAERKRTEAQVTGRQLAGSDPAAAGVHYDTTAAEWGDPILYLDAADAYYAAAEKDREIPLAEAGIERAHIALDLLFFQLDAAADPNFRLIDTADIPDLITRANNSLKTGEELVAKLKADVDAAVATAATPKKEKRKRKPVNGRKLFIAGAAVTGIGGGVLGLGAVGLILGAVRQNQAEKPGVYGDEYDAVEAKGKRANVLAGVGLGIGGALALGGVVMMIVGKRAEKKSGDVPQAAAARLERKRSVRLAPALNGVAISGRF